MILKRTVPLCEERPFFIEALEILDNLDLIT